MHNSRALLNAVVQIRGHLAAQGEVVLSRPMGPPRLQEFEESHKTFIVFTNAAICHGHLTHTFYCSICLSCIVCPFNSLVLPHFLFLSVVFSLCLALGMYAFPSLCSLSCSHFFFSVASSPRQSLNPLWCLQTNLLSFNTPDIEAPQFHKCADSMLIVTSYFYYPGIHVVSVITF